jgi:hypothetical protein
LAAVNNNGALFLFEKIVAEPTGVDLAILKFRANDVPFLRLGDSTDKVTIEPGTDEAKGVRFTHLSRIS